MVTVRAEGNSGRSGREYGDPLAVLRGRLASDIEGAVYPEDRCLQCEREGKVAADEKCFHRHWETADEVRPSLPERRLSCGYITTSNTEAECRRPTGP